MSARELEVGLSLVAKLRAVLDDEAFDVWVDDYGSSDVVSFELLRLKISALGRMALEAVRDATSTGTDVTKA